MQGQWEALVPSCVATLITTTKTSAECGAYWWIGIAMSTTASSNRPHEIAWPVVTLTA
jgi:hypothetical protein